MVLSVICGCWCHPIDFSYGFVVEVVLVLGIKLTLVGFVIDGELLTAKHIQQSPTHRNILRFNLGAVV